MEQPKTAKNLSMAGCHRCGLLVRLPRTAAEGVAGCPRCGATIHQRRPGSIQRTWALVITALILYIPANVLPISITGAMGSSHGDTILSGVIYFIQSGSWHIALVIFIASVLVPMMKILILVFLLVSVQWKWQWRPLDRTRLYRLIEMIGRWSMVDIFVIAIMAALIKLEGLADFKAGPATIYFAAVVVITILASMSFDPRLIWDNMEDESHE